MIKIETVQESLQKEGWELISKEYKNLKTPLEMKCPKGHVQERTFEDWRKHPVCEVCLAGDPFRGRLVPPKSKAYRILALDAATNTSGYSLFDDEQLVTYGIFKTNSSKTSTERINEFKKWLKKVIDLVNPDFVGVENIQLQTYNKSNQVETYRVLANLQGVILDTLLEKGIKNDLVYSSVWRKYCGIDGVKREERKRATQQKVSNWYSIKPTQDEADAICIGKYFVRYCDKNDWGEEI